jgi:putative flavoprotein involved in K+ transport
VEWLVDLGFFDQRPEDLPDPSVVRAPQPLLAPGGRSASLQSLARAGAVLVGRLTTVDGQRVGFDADVAANIDFADAFAERIRTTIDDAIIAKGLDAPPTVSDDAVAPADLRPRLALDLDADGIDSIVWCTGYTGNFSWLESALTDSGGQPVRDGAAGAAPGLWYMGLRWLTRRGSGNFIGFPADAAAVAAAVTTHLGGMNVRRLALFPGQHVKRDRGSTIGSSS